MVTDVVVAVLAWVVPGVLCAAGYAAVWRCRPRLRHVALWPVVAAYMLWAFDLPAWAAPAPRQDEARRVRRRYGLPAR